MLQKTWTLRRLMQVGLLCLAMFALWQAVSPITRQPAQASSSVADHSVHPALTRPIETIRPGMRVVAGNPETEGPSAADSPIEPQSWRLFCLRMAKPDGTQLDVELLRPMEWALAQALARAEQINDQTFGLPRPLTIAPSELPLAELILGKELLLDLPELGASGPATVTAVLPCPEIEAVRGVSQRLVTGTFHHSAANVMDLQVASEKEPIGTTDNHPFWSEDRRAFIAAGELQLGETLLLANGTHTQVTSITPHTGPPVEVFNLEVDVDHTYHVGDGGVLVHNAYPFDRIAQTFKDIGQQGGVVFDEVAISGNKLNAKVGYAAAKKPGALTSTSGRLKRFVQQMTDLDSVEVNTGYVLNGRLRQILTNAEKSGRPLFGGTISSDGGLGFNINIVIPR